MASLGCLALTGCLAPERSPLLGVDWPEATREAVADAAEDAAAEAPAVGFAAGEAEAVRIGGSGELRLTLGRTLLMTLAANRELAVSAQSPAIAAALQRVQRGVFDPEAFAELTYQERSITETSRATGERFSVDGDDLRTVAGLRQLLPTGTEVELSVDQQRSSSDRAPEQQDARLGLTVTQQLLRGAGPAANLVRLRQAGLDVDASRHELRGFVQRLLADAERAWWLYRLAGQRLALFERALELAEQQSEAARRRIAAGALAPNAGAAAEAEAALRRQDLIDARSLREARRLALLRLLGGPTGDLDGPADADWLTRPVATEAPGDDAFGADPPPVDDLEERVALATRVRPELLEARVRLEQDRLETVLTRNGLLPRLEVFLDLGKAGFDDTFAGSFDDLDSESYDLATGFRFVAPLGNERAEGFDRAASATRAQSAAAVANLVQLVRLEVRRAAVELERARQQIAASRATLAFQRSVAAGERQRFEAGEATSLDAALAGRDLLAAEIAVVTSRTEHRLALIDLQLAEGSLLQRRGIGVEAGGDAAR
ncbi:putative efflux system outer membrane protein [Phycisphaera mikurensis NBRC 102666]|uniref:Putative efflux system outer membrane protein n=1 Tax=Phycisphaera mikurensis (strain NBRC 102666 / KCTC 22515 / FYK2301M01) TaxID=1142394 RepID=I0IEF9_PHYMF|nr:putative efflux system outer membrane protein [Phycisphaera mikurensis NBRC 102666]